MGEIDYTIDEVAAILRLNRKTIEREILRGNLDAYRAGRRQYRISRDALDRYKQRRQVRQPGKDDLVKV